MALCRTPGLEGVAGPPLTAVPEIEEEVVVDVAVRVSASAVGRDTATVGR